MHNILLFLFRNRPNKNKKDMLFVGVYLLTSIRGYSRVFTYSRIMSGLGPVCHAHHFVATDATNTNRFGGMHWLVAIASIASIVFSIVAGGNENKLALVVDSIVASRAFSESMGDLGCGRGIFCCGNGCRMRLRFPVSSGFFSVSDKSTTS